MYQWENASKSCIFTLVLPVSAFLRYWNLSNWYTSSILCHREGSVRGYGIRTAQSVQGSDSWIDDPITRHVISLYINNEEEGDSYLLWPLVLHIKGPYYILALPLVEPHHLKTYARMLKQSDCGSVVGMEEDISALLLDLPSITGYGKLCTMLPVKRIRNQSIIIFPLGFAWFAIFFLYWKLIIVIEKVLKLVNSYQIALSL